MSPFFVCARWMVAAAGVLSISAAAAASEVDIKVVGIEVLTEDPALEPAFGSGRSSRDRPGTTVVIALLPTGGRVLAVDLPSSSLAEFADDRGQNLLAVGEQLEEKRQVPGRQSVGIRFGGGVTNGLELDRMTKDGGAVVNARSLAPPASGATRVRLQGRFAVTIGRNDVTDEFPNVKLEEGASVRLGEIQATLRRAGSPGSWKLSSDAPLDAVVDLQAIEPDGKASATFGSGNGKVDGILPSPGVTHVTLRIRRYRDATRENVPFDLGVGLGLGAGAEKAAATSTPQPDATAPTCVNPYAFPSPTGGRWIYEETNTIRSPGTARDGDTRSTHRATTTVTRKPNSATSFTEYTRQRGEGSDSSSSVEWSCGAEGLRSSPDVGVMMLVPMEGLGPWQEVGVDVPPAPAWRVGAKWRRVAKASSSDASAMVKNVVLTNDYEIVARETVTVPAGSYDAFKVRSTASLDADGSKTTGRLLTTTMTTWHGENVGIVRAESVSTVHLPGSDGGARDTNELRMERTIALKDVPAGSSP